jgi:hypothetical protein
MSCKYPRASGYIITISINSLAPNVDEADMNQYVAISIVVDLMTGKRYFIAIIAAGLGCNL